MLEVVAALALLVLYAGHYLARAVKRPRLVCAPGEFRATLEALPVLREPYWPTPWCVEAHLQTVVGSVLRTALLPRPRSARQVVRLADGGRLALDWLDGGPARARAVLVVLPGLTGDAGADYVRCVAAAATRLGAHCVVFNNRGLGGLALATPRLYCALSHEDLAEALRAVAERAEGAPLLAVGVSLGGLILGHYLARSGADSLVSGALVVSSPLDVIKGSECMERGALNAALSYHMARNLRNTVLAHEALRPHWAGVRAVRSVREFDGAFTARHFGFGSVAEYYAEASLRGRLAQVRVPLLCLCAADDPFQPLGAVPEEEALRSGSVALAVTARGGHIGFLEGWWPARAAADQFVARLALQYFEALLARR